MKNQTLTKKGFESYMSNFAGSVKKGFDAVDTRFEKVDERFYVIEKRIDKFEKKTDARFTELLEGNDKILSKFLKWEQENTFGIDLYRRHDGQLKDYDKRLKRVEKKLKLAPSA